MKVNLNELEREYKRNEKEVARLIQRNEKISEVFTAIGQLTGAIKSGSPIPGTAKSKMLKENRSPKPGTLKYKVMDALSDGFAAHVNTIYERVHKAPPPTQDRANAMSNILAGLVRSGLLVRVSKAIYRTKFPKPNPRVVEVSKPTPVTEEPQKANAVGSSRIDIGADTHVRRILPA